jgi:hypothetical protein
MTCIWGAMHSPPTAPKRISISALTEVTNGDSNIAMSIDFSAQLLCPHAAFSHSHVIQSSVHAALSLKPTLDDGTNGAFCSTCHVLAANRQRDYSQYSTVQHYLFKGSIYVKDLSYHIYSPWYLVTHSCDVD